MSKTTSQENAVLDAGITGYWAAFSTLITEAGSGTEVTGTSYARVNLASLMASASGGAKASASEIAFPTSGAAWPTIKSFGLMDASSGGSVKRSLCFESGQSLGVLLHLGCDAWTSILCK